MIGETFGSYDSIKNSGEFMGYKLTDRGYLLQFASQNEAKFLTNNFIFQRIMQK